MTPIAMKEAKPRDSVSDVFRYDVHEFQVERVGDQRQVYAQIAGQKAVLLQLESDMAFTMDSFVFYQASSAGMTGAGLAGNGKGLSKMFSELGCKVQTTRSKTNGS